MESRGQVVTPELQEPSHVLKRSFSKRVDGVAGANPNCDLLLREYEVRRRSSLACHPHAHGIFLLGSLCDIAGRLDADGPHLPRSAFDNALLFTVEVIRDELDAVSRQRAGRGPEIQVLQDLKVVVELLEKLSDVNVCELVILHTRLPNAGWWGA